MSIAFRASRLAAVVKASCFSVWWPRLIGQNVPFLQCSPAVLRLHGLSQCRHTGEVALIRRCVVTRRVRPALVVKRHVFLSSALGLADAVVGMQIHLFVFDTLPESFHEYMIPPTTGDIHADLNAVVFQQPSELQAGELAPLVSIEDVRCAKPGDRLLDRLDAKVSGQRIGQPP